MVEEGLKIRFIAEDGQLSKSLGELQKDAKGFKKELESVKNIDAFNRISKQLADTQARMVQLQQVSTKSLGAVSKGGNQATAALTDLSRIAQDAPYGFIGIANNLNPMLESFQRLKAETGSTKTALASMAGALGGPAGIGLAIGVVSSLLVAFGDELFKSEKGVDANVTALKAFNDVAEASKTRIADITSEISQLNRLGKINLQIQLDDPRKINLQDLRGQSMANRSLIGDLEKELAGLQDNYNRVLDNFYKKAGTEARVLLANNLFESAGLNELDTALLQSVKKAYDAIQDASKDLNKAQQGQVVLYREIELEKVEAQREANKKAAEEHKKRMAALKKQQEEERDLWEKFNAWVKSTRLTDISSVVPEVTVPFASDNIDNLLGPLRTQMERLQAMKLNLNPFAGFDADRSGIITEYEKAFKTLGRKIPEFLTLDTGAVVATSTINNLQLLQKTLQSTFSGMKEEIQSTAAMLTSLLAPAFQNMFSAIVSGEEPLRAFFAGIQQSMFQLIQQLMQAAVQALILSSLTSGGTSIAGALAGLMGRGPRMFATGGIVSGPTLGMVGEYAGARRDPEVIAPLSKLRSLLPGVGGGGTIAVTGVLRGPDMYLQNRRTERRQRRNR